MQFAFGIVAWDYTGTFLSIDGRTNGMFMAMWGCLGVVWIKLLLPWMLKLVNLIPWNLRYTVTTVCAALMIVDCAMTLIALDCWYQREAGDDMGQSALVEFFDTHFDNAYMQERFQSMSINRRSHPRTVAGAPGRDHVPADPESVARSARTAKRPSTTPARHAATLPDA